MPRAMVALVVLVSRIAWMAFGIHGNWLEEKKDRMLTDNYISFARRKGQGMQRVRTLMTFLFFFGGLTSCISSSTDSSIVVRRKVGIFAGATGTSTSLTLLLDQKNINLVNDFYMYEITFFFERAGSVLRGRR